MRTSCEDGDKKRQSCSDRAMTAWGWFFDFFLIVVNLTDVITDCLIARQFWVDGHKTFFGLVLASLLLASVIYTVVGVELVWREKFHHRHSRLFQYLILLPFSQLMPVINWAVEQWKPTSISSSEVAQWDRPECATGISAEEADAMAGASKLMERLDVALARHMRSHALFYVESVVEAIPQAIVQLLAVTFLGEATPLQVFSLALSMVSIISKGYVLSRAFGVPEMAFKFFVGAHDLFSLFYIFATLISNASSPDVHISGDLFIDYMSVIWVLKLCVLWGYVILVALGLGLILLIHNMRHIRSGTLWDCLDFGLAGTLLAIPAMILVEGGKLLWANFLMTSLDSSANTMFPKLAMWYNFCNRGGSSTEWNERFRYICLRHIEFRALATMPRPSRLKGSHTAVHCSPPEATPTTTRLSPSANPFRGRQQHRMLTLNSTDFRGLPRSLVIVWSILNEKPFHPWNIFRKTEGKQIIRIPSNWNGKLLFAVAAFAVFIYVIGQLYSLVFPFVHFGIAYRSGHVNLLQQYCFYGTAGCMVVVLLLMPRAFSYVIFNLAADFAVRQRPAFLRQGQQERTLERYIEDYFLPPHAFFIADAVPADLLPMDLVGTVAKFLRRDDLKLREVTAEDCRRVKERMMDVMTAMEGEAESEAAEPTPLAIPVRIDCWSEAA